MNVQLSPNMTNNRKKYPNSDELGYYFTMEQIKTLGGARPGAGRKPKVAGAPATQSVTIKMSPQQKSKLKHLGGPTWVRGKIDDAPSPAASVDGDSRLKLAKAALLESNASLIRSFEDIKSQAPGWQAGAKAARKLADAARREFKAAAKAQQPKATPKE